MTADSSSNKAAETSSKKAQDVVRIWQDLAKTAKMLVRGSTRAVMGKLI